MFFLHSATGNTPNPVRLAFNPCTKQHILVNNNNNKNLEQQTQQQSKQPFLSFKVTYKSQTRTNNSVYSKIYNNAHKFKRKTF